MMYAFLTIWLIFLRSLLTVRSETVCSSEDLTLNWNNIGKDDADSWNLCTDKPPGDAKLWPSVGNGHVATVVHSNTVYMNGLYNGNGTDSTRARIPAMTSLNVSKINLPYSKISYCLQLDKGIYVETYQGDHWTMELKIYAHRTMSRLLVTELTVQANGNHSRLSVSLDVKKGNDSVDIDFTSTPSGLNDTMYMHGLTKIAETPESGRTPVHVYYSRVPNSFVIGAGKTTTVKHTFLMAVGRYKDETKKFYIQGIEMKLNDTLESSHRNAWHEVWDAGRVDIYGNTYLSAVTYSSLYYIFSAMPTVEEKTWPFVGLSPADLAHDGYKGHIFWDQDTWMFTPILLLNSDLGRTIVNTRIRVLDSAKEYAKRTSFAGARFPWEGALSGFDVTPWFSGEYEDHVTGDVAQAFQQYIMLTHDTRILLHENMSDAIFAMADFWISRSSYDVMHDTYNIFDVMPPDEYHYPVNNSVYTNFLAQKSLLLPSYVCELTGCHVPPKYADVARRIKIPFDSSRQYHPEFDGYNTSITVKQADVILLGWPLEMNMSEEIRRNDLEIYAKVTPGGPAMSWGMFTIGWLEIGELDKANTTFYDQLKNRRDPFNIWTENADGSGTTNFITGMGGYLHSLIFGYAGVRFNKDSLSVNCSPFPDTSSYRLKDIDYIGNSIDVTCDDVSTKLTLVRGTGIVKVTLSTTGQTLDLKIGTPVCVPRQKLIITVTEVSETRMSTNIPPTTTTTAATTATTSIITTTTTTSVSSTVRDASCIMCQPILWTCFLSVLVVLSNVLI
ncbi:protein-glucosylgalactosylhydroxylysine glucosidase-like isoform X2 [Ruditapes philippinarum]|uniref:protein-glucosylgalactosylhydroxylysine glucosidase-like isoform X2 n=1 Tax=Ruditapes philippinarum TaxID=129788 RepID=UPI00295BFC4C|nr:protein-glucosylgalactosylhydroxylysine glucosidase-like isoform X2 [Ruditapes philippinarum]